MLQNKFLFFLFITAYFSTTGKCLFYVLVVEQILPKSTETFKDFILWVHLNVLLNLKYS